MFYSLLLVAIAHASTPVSSVREIIENRFLIPPAAHGIRPFTIPSRDCTIRVEGTSRKDGDPDYASIEVTKGTQQSWFSISSDVATNYQLHGDVNDFTVTAIEDCSDPGRTNSQTSVVRITRDQLILTRYPMVSSDFPSDAPAPAPDSIDCALISPPDRADGLAFAGAGLAATAGANPFVDFVGRYMVVSTNSHHAHAGDIISIEANGDHTSLTTPGYQVEMSTSYTDEGEGHFTQTSYLSAPDTAEYTAGGPDGGSQYTLKHLNDDTYSFTYESSRGAFRLPTVSYRLRKLN